MLNFIGNLLRPLITSKYSEIHGIILNTFIAVKNINPIAHNHSLYE